MDSKRRGFLQGAGVAGAVALTAGTGLAVHGNAVAVGAGTGARPAGAARMPRGMTFVTMVSDGGFALGVKTERGILDVKKAARHHRSAVPATIDDLIRGGDGGLTDLVNLAIGKGGKALFQDERAIEFGPCVTNPEKILCVGLNYARHARETNNPIPKLPILFNKFNNALNSHQGTVRADLEASGHSDQIGQWSADLSE